jgi:hypothetical protein
MGENHSLQGHNGGPTAKHQTPNDIQRIVIHLGEQTDETLNPGLMYVVVSIAKNDWRPLTRDVDSTKMHEQFSILQGGFIS